MERKDWQIIFLVIIAWVFNILLMLSWFCEDGEKKVQKEKLKKCLIENGEPDFDSCIDSYNKEQ